MSVASKSENGTSVAGGSEQSIDGGLGALNRDEEQQTHSFESGLFGVLFTVSKEKFPGKAFVAFRIFMDWLQIFLLVVNPAYGFNIDSTNTAWRIFSFIGLNQFMMARGYTFFLVLMYILAAALAANLGLCVWVSHSFKTNNFDHIWPIVLLRYFSLVFYQVLDIACLSLFLMTMDCQYFSVPEDMIGRHAEFPEIMCWTMPHMVHVGVASLSVVLFCALAAVFTLGEIELNPISRNPLGMAHTTVEVQAFLIRTIMTCTSVFINGLRWMSILQLTGALLLAYLYLRWLPHLHAWVNYIRVAATFSILWAAAMLTLMVFQLGIDPSDPDAVQAQRNAYSIAMWAGLVPCALAGWGLAHWRTQYFVVTVANKFRDAPLDMKPTHIHEFTDPREVEITSRCCRVWVTKDVLDEEMVQVAERIIRAGMTMLHEPYMAIWWSSFLMDVRSSYQSGYVALQAAKKMPNPSFIERFCIFIREQEHTQKASAASSGDNTSADLVSYVEFQRNYRLVVKLQVEALKAQKNFWEGLLHSEVSFHALAASVARVDETIRQSEQMYKKVLSRHSNSVKLLVLYVKFLKYIRNDPWNATRWATEAEKLQKAEEEANERAVLGEGSDDKRKIKGFDENKGIVIVSANCLISMVNESAATMFGYRVAAELVGRNINVLVPPPFSRNHNNYIRSFIETGVTKVLGLTSEVVAAHKDGYVIPVKMYVTKVSGIGEDSVFMGVFQQLPTEPDVATVWLMASGQILSCDALFTDWMSHKQDKIHMKPFRDLLLRPGDFDNALNEVKKVQAGPKYLGAARRASYVSVRPSETGEPSVHYLEAPMSPFKPISTSSNTAALLPISEESKTRRPPSRTPSSILGGPGAQGYWNLNRVQVKHGFLSMPVEMNASMHMSGLVDTPIVVVNFKRRDMESESQYLMVVDDKGRIHHVTSQLAARLGTTTSALMGSTGGLVSAMDTLLPEPFVKLHRWWMSNRPGDIIPPWSCRTGLCVPVVTKGQDGNELVPFSVSIRSKEVESARGQASIVTLDERTHEQMLDERRLSLLVSSKGVVLDVGTSPRGLFRLESDALVGCSIMHILDVFRPPLELAASADVSALLDHEDHAAKVLLLMAKKSHANPGCSWRVGVSPVRDPVAQLALGDLGQEMLAERTVPAVMTVTPHLDAPQLDGAKEVLPSELRFRIELWRADLLSGVLEVDASGNVANSGFVKSLPVYSPHRLLGLPASLVQGTALAPLLGCAMDYSSLVNALFTEGGMSGRQSMTQRAGAKGGLRSTHRQKKEVGPLHTIKLRHGLDGQELELQVQAIAKQDSASGSSLFLILHVANPKCGVPDFLDWLPNSPNPVRPQAADIMLAKTMSLRSQRPALNGLTSLQMGSQQFTPVKKKAVTMFQEPEDAPDTPIPAVRDDSVSLNAPSPFMPKSLPQPTAASPRGAKFAAALAAKEKGGDDDDGSLNGELNAEKRAHISTWVAASALDPDEMEDPIEDDLDAYEDNDDDQEATDNKQQGDDQRTEEDPGDALDEAGASMNDFKRGKRLKKLIRVMESAQARGTVRRFKIAALVCVAVLFVVDLALFIVFMSLVNRQIAQVNALRQAARAGSRVMQICQLSTSIGLLISSRHPLDPNMKYLGMGKVEDDIQANIDLMVERVNDLDNLHHGIYRGFDNQIKNLPDAFGLRELWDTPTIPSLSFHKQGNITISTQKNDSLWAIGNNYIRFAGSIADTVMEAYPHDDETLKYEFANDTRLLYILYNGPRWLVESYTVTLDGLMQVSVQDAQNFNEIQLIIMGVEGVFVALTTFMVVAYVTKKVLLQRYRVFTIFLKVPQGVIKAEATRANNLLEGGEDEDEGEQRPEREDITAGNNETAGQGLSGVGKKFTLSGAKGADSKSAEGVHASGSGKPEAPPLWERVKAVFVNLVTKPPPEPNAKRTIKSSWIPVMMVAWPFLFWALFVILINALGWQSLSNISAPIAISNIVQFVSIRVNKMLFFSQRYSSQTYLNPAYGYTAEPDIPGSPVVDQLKTGYREILRSEYNLVLREYDAMLYGRQAISVRNETSPHFQLAERGIIFDPEASYIFHDSGCLAENVTDCMTPDDPFYRYVSNGLDQALKHLFVEVLDLLMLPNEEVVLDNLPFDYIYEVGNRQIIGALEKLIDVYSNHVQAVYHKALTLHIVALAICCVMGIAFIFILLFPFINRVANERRRVAELLSHLPAEVDIEGMLASAIDYNPVLGHPGKVVPISSG